MNSFDRAEAAWEARQDAAMEARHAAEEQREELLESLTSEELIQRLDDINDLPSWFLDDLSARCK